MFDFEQYKKKWPEGEYTFLSEDGTSSDSPMDSVWYSELKFCGCYSHSLFNLVFDILHKLYRAKLDEGSYYYDYENRTEAERDLQELILHVFDSKDWTEHGSAVRGCWLTDKGANICKLIFEAEAPSGR